MAQPVFNGSAPETCFITDEGEFKSRLFSVNLLIIQDASELFVLAAALPLYLVLVACKKINWTVTLLFFNTYFRAVSAVLSLLIDMLPTLPSSLTYGLLIGYVFELCGSFCRNIYLYRRCCTLIPVMTKRPILRNLVHICFWILIITHLGANSVLAFYGGGMVEAPNGARVWANVSQSPLIANAALWIFNVLDLFSCSIILASIMKVRNPRRGPGLVAPAGRTQELKQTFFYVVRAQEFRISIILFFGVIHSIMFWFSRNYHYQSDEYAYSVIIHNYIIALRGLLLIIDASLMLLYTYSSDGSSSRGSGSSADSGSSKTQVSVKQVSYIGDDTLPYSYPAKAI